MGKIYRQDLYDLENRPQDIVIEAEDELDEDDKGPTILKSEVVKVGLGVPCSPRDPRFVGSNPAEVDGFFQDIKILSTSPPGGTLS